MSVGCYITDGVRLRTTLRPLMHRWLVWQAQLRKHSALEVPRRRAI